MVHHRGRWLKRLGNRRTNRPVRAVFRGNERIVAMTVRVIALSCFRLATLNDVMR